MEYNERSPLAESAGSIRGAEEDHGAEDYGLQEGCCDVTVRALSVFAIFTALTLGGSLVVSTVIDLFSRSAHGVHLITILVQRIFGIFFCMISACADCHWKCLREFFGALRNMALRGLFFFFVGSTALEMSYECDQPSPDGTFTGEALRSATMWTMWTAALIFCIVGVVYILFGMLCVTRCLNQQPAESPRTPHGDM
eukprot:TRINITY_DN17069_c0_g1_i1.p1 TRINITY_DN17069_c0_g1~~TRINITY_DN17069_c0_g1_i1.p1  ORF type:complete len:219 (+),score=65.36 TRINITY_DN17069_c0_g1_i1:67-657(+)